jgi:Transcriptional regulatory protein, C terminal
VLKFFAQNLGRVISRDELVQVLGYQNYPTTRAIDNRVLTLRHKLERDPTNRRIRSISERCMALALTRELASAAGTGKAGQMPFILPITWALGGP